jgi:predicted molibdopterin-dependent oxidoreductase YjgC
LITLTIDGKKISVAEGTTVAAAILSSGIGTFRTSVSGERRAPLCGMGTCFECRVTIDGLKHQRSCMRIAENGMKVVAGE